MTGNYASLKVTIVTDSKTGQWVGLLEVSKENNPSEITL